MASHETSLQQATDRLAAAHQVLILSGAGMSAESGVPTFREAQTGLWARYSPEELATPDAFAANPVRVMDWYRWRRDIVAKAKPNAGHLAIARWQSAHPGTVVATQNVDGLHQRAALAFDRAAKPDVIELHGRLSHLRCIRCGEHAIWPDDDPGGLFTHDCGGRLRPDIVWFGESLPVDALRRVETLASRCDVCVVVGTSGLVYPAAELPLLAKDAGAFVIEINPKRTPLSSRCDVVIEETAASAMPALLRQGCVS